ncbi:sensor domain-containing protein [Streptomyces sp. NPDC002935]|uniref:sensor histidine kinase n=1 Tax=Streptomyces sp. NPDC002935 TaxID=3154545 RepID=UPI0033AA9754
MIRPVAYAGYLVGGVLVGAPLSVGLLVLGAVGAALTPVLVGLPLLGLLALTGIPVGVVERRRLRWVDAPAATGPAEGTDHSRSPADPHRTPDEPGLAAWAGVRFAEQATWRELAYAVLLAFVLWPLDLVVLAVALGIPGAMAGAPVQLALSGGDTRIAKLWLVDTYGTAFLCAACGLLLLLVLLWPLALYARGRAALARLLIAPREAEQRLAEVTESRARLVAAFEAERRRIERDLHDGAQQRLVALSMTLGLARLDAPPELAGRLAAAHREADQVLGELRELIHGIHPQVLADYGLADAIADAADRSAVPVEVDVALPRFTESVESAAYFAVREALANVGRHSGADRAWISAGCGEGDRRGRGGGRGRRLWIEVRDDGRGGAAPSGTRRVTGHGGSGLTGLADRLAVLDGTLTVDSPPGGPTVLRMEIPC